MKAVIYIEGGASGPNSRLLSIRCQQAFSKLLDQMGFKDRKPRLKACGGRQSVYDDFCTAHRSGGADYVALWIDSEEPMADIEKAWDHLKSVKTVPAWERPAGAEDDQILFMTTCMETWIAADRNALRAYFGPELNEKPLPSTLNLEKRPRNEVQSALANATRQCRSPYAKGKRSYEVLKTLDPAAVRPLLPSFVRVERILLNKLREP